MSTGGGAGVPGRPVRGGIPSPPPPRSAPNPALSALASLEMPTRLHAAHHCLRGSTEPLRRPSLPAVRRCTSDSRSAELPGRVTPGGLSCALGGAHSWGGGLHFAGRLRVCTVTQPASPEDLVRADSPGGGREVLSNQLVC